MELPAAGLDVAGLAERIVPFPVAAGRYDKLRAVTDGVVWLELPRAGELGETVIGADEEHPTRLIRYDLAQRKRSVEVEALDDYAVSGNGARLAYRIGESLKIKPAGEPDADALSVDLDRIQVTVEPRAEWSQMYHETWRLMRDNFWRADMAGVDWAAAGDRYRPLLDRIGSADDLHDVLWELQGEMGTSHTGIRPPGSGGDPALAQGLLGADVERAEDGTWRIARILPGESSVIGARSPLAAPGVAAAPGDLIVAVDGRPVDPDLGPNALLVGKADQPVELTLRRDGADRRVVVVPLASEHAVRYYDLVARQRAAVREASGGRLGYLHIPDMKAAGWAEFHRDLYTEFQRDGLIVDLRDAQGGDAWAAGGREARPAHHWLVPVPVRGAVELPVRDPARTDRRDDGRVRELWRRHRHPGAEVVRHRDRGRHPDLGRREGRYFKYDAGRRDLGGAADVRLVVSRRRLGARTTMAWIRTSR